MNDHDDIERALSASGVCDTCQGTGRMRNRVYGVECADCKGTGRDPQAFLRAVQALGWLLLRRDRREAAASQAPPASPEPEAPSPASPADSHGMTCDACGADATVGCESCDIASCEECEAGFAHGGTPLRRRFSPITAPWPRRNRSEAR